MKLDRLVILLLANCTSYIPMPIQQPAVQQPAVAQPAVEQPAAVEQPPANPLYDALTAAGLACNVEDTQLVCTGADGWPVYAAYHNDVNNVTIVSYGNRAFGKPCSRFKNAVNDLLVAADSFSVTCDDSSQQFQFWTTFDQVQDTDYGA